MAQNTHGTGQIYAAPHYPLVSTTPFSRQRCQSHGVFGMALKPLLRRPIQRIRLHGVKLRALGDFESKSTRPFYGFIRIFIHLDQVRMQHAKPVLHKG